jgi:hypothetical protein
MTLSKRCEIILVRSKISINIGFELVEEHQSNWMTTDFDTKFMNNHSHCECFIKEILQKAILESFKLSSVVFKLTLFNQNIGFLDAFD